MLYVYAFLRLTHMHRRHIIQYIFRNIRSKMASISPKFIRAVHIYRYIIEFSMHLQCINLIIR